MKKLLIAATLTLGTVSAMAAQNQECKHQTIELPLSKQGEKVVKSTGGCVPESKDGAEAAKVCNFFWGKHQIVKDIRFQFD